MGVLRWAGALAACLVMCTAGPALAGEQGVKVSPYRAEAGDRLKIEAYGCELANTAFAESKAFDMDVELEEESEGYWVSNQAEVAYDADPGRYRVTVTCKGDSISPGSLTVVGGRGPDTGGGGLALSRPGASVPQVETGSSVAGWVVGGSALAASGVLLLVRRRTRMRG